MYTIVVNILCVGGRFKHKSTILGRKPIKGIPFGCVAAEEALEATRMKVAGPFPCFYRAVEIENCQVPVVHTSDR